jgi:hypothetical protein
VGRCHHPTEETRRTDDLPTVPERDLLGYPSARHQEAHYLDDATLAT